jgi:hypothetical protein
VDPITAAATSAAKALTSVATKRLQSRAGVRLGSRDERRQVYARFQGAAAEAAAGIVVTALEQPLHTVWLGTRWPVSVSFRPWAAWRSASAALVLLRETNSELLQAYFELRLVANPGPLEAAGIVLDRLDALRELASGPVDAKAVTAAAEGVTEAQREFTDVCRDDLWYLPKRWQVYRPAWWRGRRWRRS